MIKLFSLKQQGKDGGSQQSSQKSTAAFLRVQKGTRSLEIQLIILKMARFGGIKSP